MSGKIFDPSLMVTLRKRMGTEAYERMNQAIMDRVEEGNKKKTMRKAEQEDKDPEPPTHAGELKVDATVVPQQIAYPTDLGLLNTVHECTEGLVDALSAYRELSSKPSGSSRRTRPPLT